MNSNTLMLAKTVAESTKNVIDALAIRGSFKGEEFAVMAQLRQSCEDLISAVDYDMNPDESPEEVEMEPDQECEEPSRDVPQPTVPNGVKKVKK